MTTRFYKTWLIVSALVCPILCFGYAALSQYSLNPTGYVPPADWAGAFGLALGFFIYWSALCWTIALLRRKPPMAAAIVAVTAAFAFLYPTLDQAFYARQQARIADAGLMGVPPDWEGKTALVIWPFDDDCNYNCWQLATHMEPRIVALTGENARDVDFSGPVDLLSLAFDEVAILPTEYLDTEQRPAQVSEIDYVIMQRVQAHDFDGVFDPLRPMGIGPNGLHIDALIVEVADPRRFSLAQAQTVLRLLHVSRTTAQIPYIPGQGRVRYWNHQDRLANYARAVSYFCTDDARDPRKCRDAFD